MRLAIAILLTCSGLAASAQSDEPWRAGAYHLARGDHPRAIASLRGVKGDPGGITNIRGVAQMMAGDLDAAAASFEQALREDSSSGPARFNRGVLLLKRGAWAAAADDFDAVFKSDGALKPAAAYHHALADQGRGDLVSAALWLTRALQVDSSFDDALLALGSVRERSSQFQEAGRAYREYLKRHPDSPVAMLRLGVCAQATGKIDVAQRYLRQVIQKEPGSAEAIEARKFLAMWE